jgi:hypothetical protein
MELTTHMNRFNRVNALWASFYSRDLYRDVVSGWKGIGLLYLLLLLAITWLPSAARWARGLSDFAATDAQTVVSQLPAIAIKDGVMTSSPPGRHVIRLGPDRRGRDQGAIIIDDSIDTLPSEADTDTLMLTRHEAGIIRPSRSERRVYTLTPAADMEVTREDVAAFFDSLAFWVPPIGYAGAVAGSLVFRLLQALMYGALVMTLARRQRVELGYSSAVRMAAVAITPVVVLKTVLWFGSWEPAWYWRWLVAMAITVAYLRFGIRAVAPSHDAPAQVQV